MNPEGKHIKLSNILVDYLSAQASDTFITDKTWPVSLLPEEHDTIIEMHPAIVYVGLKTLMSTGNVYKARRILEEFIKTGEPLPKKTEDLIDIIDDMREATCLADEGNINEAIRLDRLSIAVSSATSAMTGCSGMEGESRCSDSSRR